MTTPQNPPGNKVLSLLKAAVLVQNANDLARELRALSLNVEARNSGYLSECPNPECRKANTSEPLCFSFANIGSYVVASCFAGCDASEVLRKYGDLVKVKRDWLDDHELRSQYDTTTEMFNALELLPKPKQVEASPHPRARTWDEFMALKPKHRESLCGNWFRTAALAMVSGDSGAGKTWFCLDLALSVSTGVDFMGRWHVPSAKKVLVVSGEDDIEDLQDRLVSLLESKKKATGRELSPQIAFLAALDSDLLPNGLPNLGTKEGREKVEANLEGVSLVILDNYSVLFNGVDENDAKEFAPIQDWLFKLKARGISVLLVSHTGKNGDHRGSSKKIDGLNASIILNHPASWKASDGVSFELKFKKSRDARGDEVNSFSAKLGADEDGDISWLFDIAPPNTPARARSTKATEIISLFNAGKTQKQIEELGYAKSTISVVLSKARSEGSLTPTPKPQVQFSSSTPPKGGGSELNYEPPRIGSVHSSVHMNSSELNQKVNPGELNQRGSSVQPSSPRSLDPTKQAPPKPPSEGLGVASPANGSGFFPIEPKIPGTILDIDDGEGGFEIRTRN